jgi:hypothetical protein
VVLSAPYGLLVQLKYRGWQTIQGVLTVETIVTKLERQAAGRLVVLLALPLSSIIFSLLAAPMVYFGEGPIVVAGVIFFVAAGLAGSAGLLTGGIVLIVQLIKSNVYLKNAAAFMVAWILSVVVFVGAVTTSTN